MTRLRHFDDLGTARFVTFSCHDRLPRLNQSDAKEIISEELNRARAKYGFLIFGYVLMPEHVHLVLFPPAGMKLGLVIGEIKSHSARSYFARLPTASDGVSERAEGRRVFWQKRCYDHNCRSPETVWEKIHYCHNNPVERGLVSEPSAWRWSSYNWYQGKMDVPLVVDRMVL